MKNPLTRRTFLAGSGASVAAPSSAASKLALLGGTPVRKEKFPSWPVIGPVDEQQWMAVLRSGKWYRGYGDAVSKFEVSYARMLGSKHCLATANGTSALIASLAALGVGAGDEVLIPPYTFVATVNAVLIHHALPVFVDSDLETSQMDARKIASLITPRTRAIIPVHLGGSVADMDSILAIARKHGIAVVEDACQAHLAEWHGKKVGTLGDTGCFSFQASKNLNCGEGGALLTQSDELMERCYAYHNNGRGRKVASYDFSYRAHGANLRLTEFQAALLVTQMTRLEEQAKLREQNGAYLTSMLKEIPGILPARMYAGCTRNAYHLYMLRYQKEAFGGLPRAKFLKALAAEGIPASHGYAPLNKEPFLKDVLATGGFRAIFSPERIKAWTSNNHCPANDRLCEEAVWFTQTMLLAKRSDIEQIAEAIRKVQTQAGELLRA